MPGQPRSSLPRSIRQEPYALRLIIFGFVLAAPGALLALAQGVSALGALVLLVVGATFVIVVFVIGRVFHMRRHGS